MEEAKQINDRLIIRAIEMDGTCTGEHGVGIGKKNYLERELGKETVELMREIKKMFDPKNIMNPGKKLDLTPSNPASNPVQKHLVGKDVLVETLVQPTGIISVHLSWSGDKASKL